MATPTRRRKTSVRRKKPVRRKTAARGKKKLPNWSLLVLGLAIGLLLAWLIQLLVNGVQNPGSGLNNLLRQSKPEAARAPARTPAGGRKPAKPTYDFYTILPETETPIADRDWNQQKQAPGEQGVKYVLQAASYKNYKDADQLKARLLLNGLSTAIEKVTIDGKGTFYRVRVGPYATTAEVDRARKSLNDLGIKPLLLKLASRKN